MATNYNKKREMERSYRHFLKVSASIPDFMLKKLGKMPNNKGYIWRGMFCYGHLPAEKGKPIVIFEKHGNNLTIYEWSDHEHKIWVKVGQERKTLEYSAPRHFKFSQNSNIMDYMK